MLKPQGNIVTVNFSHLWLNVCVFLDDLHSPDVNVLSFVTYSVLKVSRINILDETMFILWKAGKRVMLIGFIVTPGLTAVIQTFQPASVCCHFLPFNPKRQCNTPPLPQNSSPSSVRPSHPQRTLQYIKKINSYVRNK